MTTQETIEKKLTESLAPIMINVENESHMHAGDATETHYKVTIISDKFEGKMLIARHRLINDILADELRGKIHALAIHAYTMDEHTDKGGKIPNSPKCEGGSK